MKKRDITEFARSLRKNQTEAESFFWQKVRNRKFNGLKFNRQYAINYSQVMNEEYYCIEDFFCSEHKLIIELDGPIHDYQIDYDKMRKDILKNMNFKILRFKNEEVLNHWEIVEEKLLKVCDMWVQ